MDALAALLPCPVTGNDPGHAASFIADLKSRSDVILSAGGRARENSTDLMLFLAHEVGPLSIVAMAVVLNLQGQVLPDGAQLEFLRFCSLFFNNANKGNVKPVTEEGAP
mmetsp:Transcript_2999/g.6947  ORF Transcript_2999/g.6947 Transcript_2999/m.6947 type:complete len:109 (+) Transcript_2999:96-422(+)